MRAEDIVGVSFFLLLLPALVLTLSGSATKLSAKQRALRRGWGLSLVSFAVTAMGLVNFQLIRTSQRPVVEGNLWDIQGPFHSGRNGTHFMITDATGHAVMIRCNYNGPGLVEGERARVHYVAYNQKLLELQMLTGPFTAWGLQESSGEYGWWGWVVMGAICGFAAYHQLSQARSGAAQDGQESAS